jgi:hypothetical protein
MIRTRILAALVALAATGILAAPASAAMTRQPLTPIGSFTSQKIAGQGPTVDAPQALTVDQANGDVYALDPVAGELVRLTASGKAHNFTAGPGAGTNALPLATLNGSHTNEIAIDNSGGPADGDIYVADGNSGTIAVFANSGASLGTLNGSGTPDGGFGLACGVAVNQTNGDVYVGDLGSDSVWRYSPSSTVVSESDYSGGIRTANPPCSLAANGNRVYAGDNVNHTGLGQFDASDFSIAPSTPTPTMIERGVASPAGTVLNPTALAVDPASGNLYVDESSWVAAFAPDGAFLYLFAGDGGSSGIAVAAGGNVYVSAPAGGSTSAAANVGASHIDVFGQPVPQPGYGFSNFDGGVFDADGSTVTQAGSHPYEATTTFSINELIDPSNPAGSTTPVEMTKDVKVDLPAGFIGDPTAVPQCTPQKASQLDCPDDTAVGIAAVQAGLGGIPTETWTAVYNVAPPAGVPAEFAFQDNSFPVRLVASVRSGGDYGLTVVGANATEQGELVGAIVTFWGVPSDPSHDGLRGDCARGEGLIGTRPGADLTCPSGQPPKAFLTLPTSCTGPATTTISADSWENPGTFVSASFVSHDLQGNPVGATGCDRLDFSPSITLKPDTASADAPAGLSVDLHMPLAGLRDPNGLAEANLRKAVVTLPAGYSVNPSSANGLDACSSDRIALSSPEPATCPDASKIGSVEIDTPLLDHPIKGGVYLARQSDNPFKSLLAIYIAVSDPKTGIVVKLPGHVEADATTGQLKTTFDNNPQLPFTDLKVDFFGGPRGALATPQQCGTYTATAEFTPWSGTASVTRADQFDVTSGCQNGFHPSFTAGTQNPHAGAFSPFVLSFSRSDTDESFQGLSVTLPAGLLGKLAGVQECSEAQLAAISTALGAGGAEAASPSCPAGSQVGTVTSGAGVGPSPFFLGGKAYLTGPYKGAPYGLVVVIPAQAGPFDLGNVVVRQRLEIDPIDAHVTAISDPLPTILDGIPLRVRRVDVTLDRPDFTLNPTSCAAKQIQAQLVSTSGTLADLAAPFSVGGCSDLAYAPKLAIALTGKGQTTDDKHPGVHAVLTQPVGQANNKKVTVSLPLSLALDPDNAQSLCEFTDGSKVDPTCPKGSIVGTATANSPILDQPLSGPVYFVKNIRKDPKSGREIRTLPKLVIPLTGQNGLRLTVTGTSNVVDNHLVSTFDNLPDAPVSDFTLDIDGGKHGILVVSGTDICKSTQIATREADGQNGKQANADVYLQTSACPLKIITKKVGKTSVAVKVGGLGAGKVTVTGKGIKKTTKIIASSTVATITAKRTKGKPGKVTVSFDPTGPAKARKTSK